MKANLNHEGLPMIHMRNQLKNASKQRKNVGEKNEAQSFAKED